MKRKLLYTNKEIASFLGIHRITLYHKIKGAQKFTEQETKKLGELLLHYDEEEGVLYYE